VLNFEISLVYITYEFTLRGKDLQKWEFKTLELFSSLVHLAYLQCFFFLYLLLSLNAFTVGKLVKSFI
jgi:hypothetical protein